MAVTEAARGSGGSWRIEGVARRCVVWCGVVWRVVGWQRLSTNPRQWVGLAHALPSLVHPSLDP